MSDRNVKLDLRGCLSDFARRFPPKKENANLRRTLADFTGASFDGAVRHWLGGGRPPVGTYAWKAIVFFQLLGYDVEEYRRLGRAKNGQAKQRCCVLFAADLISDREFAAVYGYTGQQAMSQLFVALREAKSLSDEKESVIKTFADEYTEAAEEFKATFVREYAAVIVKQSVPQQIAPVPVVPESTSSTEAESIAGLDPMLLAKMMGLQIKALLPVAAYLESDQVSDDVRKQLREAAGGDGVFKLANALHRLCGETARKNMRGNNP